MSNETEQPDLTPEQAPETAPEEVTATSQPDAAASSESQPAQPPQAPRAATGAPRPQRGGGGGGRPGGGGGGRPGGRGDGPGGNRPGGRGPAGQPARQTGNESEEERSEWREKVIQIRRVTKVVKGGKKLSFRAVVVVGNGSGQVGIGIGKSNEVIGAIQKGVSAAKKSVITVPIHKTTIPHPIQAKAGGSMVVLRPASEGTGVIAGGAARALLELAGVENILSKSLGSNSPLNVARATLKGLAELRTFESIARGRGKSVKEILM